MSSSDHTPVPGMPPVAAGDDVGSSGGDRLAALLVCFDGKRAAGKARRSLERRLRADGHRVFDTTVLQVDGKHHAGVHDPRRVVAGALTALLTWGVFGLVTGGVASLISSAVLGAAWGGVVAYFAVHHTTKTQLGRLGSQLPANSSALLSFVSTSDPGQPLAAAARAGSSAASVALIAEDLATRVFTDGADGLVEFPAVPPPAEARLSMVLTRYRDSEEAGEIASRIAADHDSPYAVELVVRTAYSGRRRVADPKFGSAAIARANIPGWAGLGLVCGAIAGITGGGLLGVLEGGLLTGVVWGLFGLAAGALYGLWAGRAISARGLTGIGPILAPGTSTLLAWTDTPPGNAPTDILAATPTTQRLTLGFRPDQHGAILEAIQ